MLRGSHPLSTTHPFPDSATNDQPLAPPTPCSLKTHLSDVRQQAMYAVVHGGLSLELRHKRWGRCGLQRGRQQALQASKAAEGHG